MQKLMPRNSADPTSALSLQSVKVGPRGGADRLQRGSSGKIAVISYRKTL
jgi:hypothetical protein